VFYPLSTLPGWMQSVARRLPPSYIFESMRAAIAGRPLSAWALPPSAAVAALQVLLAGWLFARVYRYAVRQGLLARYSAEGAS
jgi:ABC-2 type transport system permease protein